MKNQLLQAVVDEAVLAVDEYGECYPTDELDSIESIKVALTALRKFEKEEK